MKYNNGLLTWMDYLAAWSFVMCTIHLEEHKLNVFENRVLRKIFRPKRDEVTEGGNIA
jgi:hypothetical protein